ncbi:MAG: hypothetical protein FJW20_24725 [Acidimicrobiia bacterium]|nr:hypothetical protein [Acidimicrobiia bacterium]
MPDLIHLERGLQWLSLAAIAGLSLRLRHEKLHRAYPCFFAYLIFEVVRSVVVLPFPTNRTFYGTIYMIAEPIVWVMYFMIVWELYTLVLRRHPGIATASRFTLAGGVAVALVVSLFTLSPDWHNPGGQFPVLHLVNVLSRAIVTTLVFFLLTITAFLVWFPVPLNRNTVYYCLGYSVFFFFKAFFLLSRNVLGPEAARLAGTANLLVATLITVVWMVKLNQAGEEHTVSIGHRWRQEEADRLVQQLNSINETLLRGVRR